MHPLLTRLLEGRDGLRVIGDVHGHLPAFAEAVDGAMRRNFAVLSLGDLIDRGPDSPGTMELGTALVNEGWGLVVPGNHEAKHLRWARGRHVRVAPNGLGRTLDQLAHHPDGEGISRRFAAMTARMPVWLRAGRFVFVHGGFSTEMLARTPPTLGEMRARDRAAQAALYGECNGETDAAGRVIRTYGWLDTVPAGITVCIGHDAVSHTEIVTRCGKRGGQVMHLDTGAGNGGRMSWIDIPADALFVPARRRRTETRHDHHLSLPA